MRAEDNPLDLNNFPDDSCSKDSKLADAGSSSSGAGGGKEGKEEKGKVYECRFCSLKFCKSQALGGHMNRHRQERETENLNNARQLLFGNGALPHHHHLGAYHPVSHMNDPILAFRSPSSSLYAPPPPPGRLFTGSSSASSSSSAHLQPYLYHSPPHQLAPYSSSQFNTANNFSLGSRGLNRPNQHTTGLHSTTTNSYGSGLIGGSSDSSTNYTCVGSPVAEVGGGSYQKEGLSWGRRVDSHHNPHGQHQHGNPSSAINRFQDGL